MSGMYGTIKPADINIERDVEIFYHYRPSLNSDDSNFDNFKTLDAASVLSPCTCKKSENNVVTIAGMFNLKLPMDKFGNKGVYTIYICPKEELITIADVGVLAAYNDVRGVVFHITDLGEEFRAANQLTGYRIEYLDDNDKKTGNFKIITSSNLCEPTSNLLTNTSEGGTKYRFNGSGNMLFCTVTPSVASTYKPNDLPPIGANGTRVILVNTKFNPVMIELEMVEHDAETIGTILTGDQLIDKDNALVTTFNKKGEIFMQSEYGVYKDEYGTPLYEFRQEKDNIDFTQNMENLK